MAVCNILWKSANSPCQHTPEESATRSMSKGRQWYSAANQNAKKVYSTVWVGNGRGARLNLDNSTPYNSAKIADSKTFSKTIPSYQYDRRPPESTIKENSNATAENRSVSNSIATASATVSSAARTANAPTVPIWRWILSVYKHYAKMSLWSDRKGRDANALNPAAKRSIATASIAETSVAPIVHAKIARMERSRESTTHPYFDFCAV